MFDYQALKNALDEINDIVCNAHQAKYFGDVQIAEIQALLNEVLDIAICKNGIDAGDTVYVIVKHKISDYKKGTSYTQKEIAECRVEKVVKKNRITKYRLMGHYKNGDYYFSTITEKAIGKSLFTDKKSAEQALLLSIQPEVIE